MFTKFLFTIFLSLFLFIPSVKAAEVLKIEDCEDAQCSHNFVVFEKIKDFNLCLKIEDEGFTRKCIEDIVSYRYYGDGDVSICDDINSEYYKEVCIFEVNKERGSERYHCNKIKDSKSQTNCHDYIKAKINDCEDSQCIYGIVKYNEIKDINFCSTLKSKELSKGCIENIIRYGENINKLTCDDINNDQYKEICIFEMNTKEKSGWDCEIIKDKVLKNDCYAQLIYSLERKKHKVKDEEIDDYYKACFDYKNPNIRHSSNRCLYLLSRKTGEKNICNDISSEHKNDEGFSYKTMCHLGIIYNIIPYVYYLLSILIIFIFFRFWKKSKNRSSIYLSLIISLALLLFYFLPNIFHNWLITTVLPLYYSMEFITLGGMALFFPASIIFFTLGGGESILLYFLLISLEIFLVVRGFGLLNKKIVDRRLFKKITFIFIGLYLLSSIVLFFLITSAFGGI